MVRLDRSSKINKLHEYAESYCEKNELGDKRFKTLKHISYSINRKKLAS